MDCPPEPAKRPGNEVERCKKETTHEKEFFEDFTDTKGLVADGGRNMLDDQIKCPDGNP